MKPLVIAHRGASSVELENSLAAFRAARGHGADGVELDVHATIDGEIVVHHDPSIMGLPIAQTRANRDEAQKRGIVTVSDLAKAINGGAKLTFASNAEFYARPDGLPG